MSDTEYGKKPPRLLRLSANLSLLLLASVLLTGCLPQGEEEEAERAAQVKKMEEEAAAAKAKREAEKALAYPTAPLNSEGSKKLDEPDTQYSQIVPEGDPVEIFNNNNIKAVLNGGTSPQFTTSQDVWLTELGTYHWNNGTGAPARTLGLESADGKTSYGPWQVELSTLGGARKVYWLAKPNSWLPAGSYRVIDSDPTTWAQNADTGGTGIAWIKGIKDTGKN